MMAREVIIRILEERPLEPSADASGSTTSEPSRSGKAGGKKEKTLSQLLTSYVGKRVWGILKNEAKYFSGKYFNTTENYKMQSYVENTLDTIDFGVSTAFSMVVGSKLFENTAIGGDAGAILGIAVAVGQKAVSTFNKFSDETQRIINNTYGNYFYAERSGYVSGGHGTEN